MRLNNKTWSGIKFVVLIVGLLPFIVLCLNTWQDKLGANPIETLHFTLGDWALRFLCLTLVITPYRQLTGQAWVNRFRRMFGLYAFFYASMHLLVYIALDLSFSWEAFQDEIKESPYILLGLTTYTLLFPLAVTSSKNMQKRLGRNWKKLHRLIYLASITAVLHFILLTKSDINEPLIYTNIIFVLLIYRIARFFKSKQSAKKLYRFE